MTSELAGVTVLHVTTTDISLELLLGPQLSAFRDAGMRVVTCSASGPHVDALTARGIEHIELRHSTRSMSLTDDVRSVAELRRVITDLRPDIIHTHNPKPGVYGRIIGRLQRVPVVVNTVHGLYAQPDDPLAKRLIVYGLERLAAQFSNAELVQNVEDLDTLQRLRVPRSRLRLLGNGVDLDRFHPAIPGETTRADIRRELGLGDDDVIVLTVGRLVAEKGFAELFVAMRTLVGRSEAQPLSVGPDGNTRVPILVVIGPTEPDKSDGITEQMVAEANSIGVRFVGFRDDVQRWYRAADVFVLASHREGFPRAAMEAAASGLPIVATNIRGCRQAVSDGVTGLLVPVRSADALAEAIGSLGSNAELRSSMSTAAIEKAGREFDQQTQIDITLETYRRLLARRQR